MKKKILVVEDEPISALSMSDLMEVFGYETCEPAATGEEAIARAEDERPDIILMDINLRGEMNGIEAAELLRRRFGTHIVFITGYVDADMRKRAEAAKPLAYLVKPLDFDVLRSVLAACPA
ncbi:MAG: response regulator [Nitrospiraceae bacterium]|nr:response regulator [Nitrospiraceae bacterium]